MEEFKYATMSEKKAMTTIELGGYHCKKRKYEFKNGVPIKGIKLRKLIHPIVVGALKLDRIMSKEKTDMLNKEKRPIIYACTHIGGSDVERIIEALNAPSFLFFGDPAPMYKDTGVHALAILKGTIELETKDKEDRHISYERAIELLTRGGDLMIFPEGAWNPFEHLPVMKLYSGTARMAIETNAIIIPVAIEQYEDRFIVNVGEKIRTHKDMDYKWLNRILRDTLATLKYEIWETQPRLERKHTTQQMVWDGVSVKERLEKQREYDEKFRQSIIERRSEYGSLDDVYSTILHDDSPTADEIIASIQNRIEALEFLKRELQVVDNLFREIKNMRSNRQLELDSQKEQIINILIDIGKRLDTIKEINSILEPVSSSLEEYDFDSSIAKRNEEIKKRMDEFQREAGTYTIKFYPSFRRLKLHIEST